jgi:DNA-binding MarR family transcriptional regulator
LIHRTARVISNMLLKQGIAPNEHIGLLIAAARRRINQALGRRLRHYRLTPRQFWILIAIREHPGFSLSEIVAHLRMDYPTASRVVVALRRRRLVEVREDAADRRLSRLYLGPVGALVEELNGLATSIRGAVTQGLRGSELEAFRALLGKVIANMDRFHDGRRTQRAERANGWGDENSSSSTKI